VIVRVRGRFVVQTLGVLPAVVVGMHERAVVVLVLVIVGSVLELAQNPARVMVRDVVVIVGVHDRRMGVFVLFVADHVLTSRGHLARGLSNTRRLAGAHRAAGAHRGSLFIGRGMLHRSLLGAALGSHA
jgi:hypothetical protein